MYMETAQSKCWPNTLFYDSGSSNHMGTLYFRYTDIGAVLILIVDDASLLNNPELYKSDPLSKPQRQIGNNHIIDLLYYCEFSIIDDPPRICFHDPVQEFGISFNFQTKEEGEDIKTFLRTYLTTEIPNLPGFYRISRFVPAFAPSAPKPRRTSAPIQPALQPISQEEYLNFVTLFQQYMTPKSSERESIAISDSDYANRDKLCHILQTSNIQINGLFSAWLSLLYLPQITKFNEDLIQKYKSVRSQWANFTHSQLIRSKAYRDYIKNLSTVLTTTDVSIYVPDNDEMFIKQLAFNIIMSIGEIDRSFHKYIHPILDILLMIFRQAKPLKDNNNKENIIVNGISVDRIYGETVLFWVLLKFMFRGELIRVLPLSCSIPVQIAEPIVQFILKTSPYIHQAIIQSNIDLSEASLAVSSLFIGIFKMDELALAWTAGLSTRNLHEFLLCIVIVSIAFNADNLSKYNSLTELFRNIISQRGFSFVLSAAIVLMKNSRTMIGTEI